MLRLVLQTVVSELDQEEHQWHGLIAHCSPTFSRRSWTWSSVKPSRVELRQPSEVGMWDKSDGLTRASWRHPFPSWLIDRTFPYHTFLQQSNSWLHAQVYPRRWISVCNSLPVPSWRWSSLVKGKQEDRMNVIHADSSRSRTHCQWRIVSTSLTSNESRSLVWK